ncbi:1,2-phenylacetyl-CoA epoxidase subunit PaaC [Saccharomonospora sp. NPDC006951]
MSFDNAYEAITEDNDSRWAFGTGFADPLEGVDTSHPSGVDPADLEAYCLMLGDDALVFSHRLQEWSTNAPELEDEVAIANIALDLLGQARLLLTRAGTRSEDEYAFFRAEHEFRNVRLAELPRGDFAELTARLLVFSSWRLAMLRGLAGSRDPVLAAIAEKGVKEVTYHRDYAARWVVRLGDGTAYSRERMLEGFAAVWPYVGELFVPSDVEERLAEAGVGVDPASTEEEFRGVVAEVCAEARIPVPDAAAIPGVAGKAGRNGVHTEAMGYLLAELQSVARAHPEASW